MYIIYKCMSVCMCMCVYNPQKHSMLSICRPPTLNPKPYTLKNPSSPPQTVGKWSKVAAASVWVCTNVHPPTHCVCLCKSATWWTHTQVHIYTHTHVHKDTTL